jgi:hypothetical protein
MEQPTPFAIGCDACVMERINGALSLPLWSVDSPGPALNVIAGALSAPARRKPVAYRIAGIDVQEN